jgi:hypothetical protein
MACTRACLHTTCAQGHTQYCTLSYTNPTLHWRVTHFLPHPQILTFVFWEQYKKLAHNL